METTPTESAPFTHVGARALHPQLADALTKIGYKALFPVQEQSFAPILDGHDVIVQSRTGSGKTAAFVLPLIEAWLEHATAAIPQRPHILVLVPTRELALQVAREFERLAQEGTLRVTAIYGGAPMGKQVTTLAEGVHVVVGTPGRVLDHLKRGHLYLDGIRTLVLDEADEMLSRGFFEEVTEIVEHTPASKQQVLLSATVPEEIERLCERSMKAPVWIRMSEEGITPSDVKHEYYLVSGVGRVRDLLRVLDVEQPKQAIVFCNTREETEEVASFLRNQGLHAQAISSNLTQRDRELVMAQVKAHQLQYLVATDIAARGIDIHQLSHVIHYTFPESPEVYIHRSGRTGRAGETGVSIALIGPQELPNFYTFKLTYPIRPEERTLPSVQTLQQLREAQYLKQLRVELVRNPGEVFLSLVRHLMADADGQRVLAAALERYLTVSNVLAEKPKVFESEPSATETFHENRSPHRQERPAHSREERKERAPRESHQRRAPLRERGAEASEPERTAGPPARERSTEPLAERKPAQPPRERKPAVHERKERAGQRKKSPPERKKDLSPAAEVVAVPHDPIELSDGREYWEAWVDARNTQPPVSDTPTPENEAVNEAVMDAMPTAPPPKIFTETESSGPKAKLYLNLGRRHGINKSRLQKLLEEHGLPLYPHQVRFAYTHMSVPEEQAEQVMAALHGKNHKRRTLVCERARPELVAEEASAGQEQPTNGEGVELSPEEESQPEQPQTETAPVFSANTEPAL